MKRTTQAGTFAAAFAAMLFFGASIVTLGSLALPLQARHGLDSVGTGAVFSMLPLGLLTGSLVFGPVADRYGYRWLLVAACLGMCAGFAGIAYAPAALLLKAAVLAIGFGGGIINGGTSALVADISGELKGPNLSLLGVFFGLGALGMPLLMALLSRHVGPFTLVSAVAIVMLAIGLALGLVAYPPPKMRTAEGPVQTNRLLEAFLVLSAFFLLCQSSFESLISNWTTTYFTSLGALTEQKALLALSLHMAGMAGMRLLIGTALREMAQQRLLWICLALLPAGIALLMTGKTELTLVTGMMLLGAGLAGGFPIMLGLIGTRYNALSGTAFSMVLVVALAGNMAVNYCMGVIAGRYGVQHLTTLCMVLWGCMVALVYFMFKKNSTR